MQRTRTTLPVPRLLLFLGIAVVCGSLAWSDIPATVTGPAVHLDARSLAQLRATNPDHYARAQRILAAANQLCRPGPDQVQYARFDAQDISCDGDLLRTSNPPRRYITFRLDNTRYESLVAITDDRPRIVQLQLAK
jgi:hypothetical protein